MMYVLYQFYLPYYFEFEAIFELTLEPTVQYNIVIFY